MRVPAPRRLSAVMLPPWAVTIERAMESHIIATHGMAKVLDLSVARAPGRHRGGIGTRGYRAPEQSVGGYLGPQSDIWGLGATLYDVATGEPACDAGDESSRRGPEAIACRPRPVCRARRLPPRLAAAIDRSLSCDPADRPTIDAPRAELEAVVTETTRA